MASSFLACAAPTEAFLAAQVPCDDRFESLAESDECLETAGVVPYLTRAQKRVYRAWQLPIGVDASQKVVLNFRLDRDGSLRCLSVASEAERELTRSVVSAFRRSAPFEAIPDGAECLADVVITARFENPER